MTMGVYCIQIEYKSWWKTYIGISKNIERRWTRHKTMLRGDCHKNSYLQNTWNKYGEKNFEFHILEKTDNYNQLLKLEEEYGKNFGYPDKDLVFNIGTLGECNPFFGRQHTKETRQKISDALKGKYIGEKNPFFGKEHTQEIKIKLSEIQRGERSSSALLSEQEARFILTVAAKANFKKGSKRDFTQQQLADMLGVSKRCIGHIQGRTRWKYIQPLSEEEYQKLKEEYINNERR